jgi:hypothetical protein
MEAFPLVLTLWLSQTLPRFQSFGQIFLPFRSTGEVPKIYLPHASPSFSSSQEPPSERLKCGRKMNRLLEHQSQRKRENLAGSQP